MVVCGVLFSATRRAGVCVCVSVCLSVNIFKLATSGPIVTKFYLKHHWGGGLIALGFGPGRIGILVSMATNSSHRDIIGEML